MHPNEKLIREFFEAADRLDIEAVQAMFTDDIALHYPGRNPVSGTYRGKDEVLSAYTKMYQLTDYTFGRVELHDILASDNHVVSLVRVGAERAGKRFEWQGIDVIHLREGKICEIWVHVGDQYGVDEFLS